MSQTREMTTSESRLSQSEGMPIVVDLDGTLTPADTLFEGVIKLVKQSPASVLRFPIWLIRGRVSFKDAVAGRVRVAVEQLPYRESLLGYLREEKARGRAVVLATAAHWRIAGDVAEHLGIFDQVLASGVEGNLKGKNKLEAIQRHYGRAFVYAGDSRADIPIWREASAAILVGVAPAVAEVVKRDVPIEREFDQVGAGMAVWMRALRAHQWLKNLLLFVPLLSAFSLSAAGKLTDQLTALVVAFFAFSLAASATYLVNDLWDLESDRAHPRKRMRPLAIAAIPISHALLVAGGAMALAFVIAAAVSADFALILGAYVVITSAYSWALKRYVIVDVLTLSLLYTLRIFAGAVAVGIVASAWLLAFSAFTFLSLALVKRCAELVSLDQSRGSTSAPGRDYHAGDLVVLWPFGVGAALSAVVVFGLFINAPETRIRYANPDLLWLVAMGLMYWLARLWIKTSRGEMHDDPVIYAIKNRGSRLTVLGLVVVVLIARLVSPP